MTMKNFVSALLGAIWEKQYSEVTVMLSEFGK